MPRLYIANCTRQNHIVCYRLDIDPDCDPRRASKTFKQQLIPPGAQQALGGEMELPAIESVIEQLHGLGLVAAVEVKRMDPRRRYPFVFNIDRPVNRKTIEEVIDHNFGYLQADGRQRRQTAAVAANEALINQLTQNGVPETKIPDEFVVDYEQEEQSENGEKRIEQGFKVKNVDDGSAPPSKPAAARRGGRRAA